MIVDLFEWLIMWAYRVTVLVLLFLILGHVSPAKSDNLEDTRLMFHAVKYAHESIGVVPAFTNYDLREGRMWLTVDRHYMSDEEAKEVSDMISQQLGDRYTIVTTKSIIKVIQQPLENQDEPH